jgi:hypothetical protein
MPIVRLSRCQQVPASEIQIRECYQEIHLAVALGQSAQSGLLESELLFNHAKWVLNLDTEVSLRRFSQI